MHRLAALAVALLLAGCGPRQPFTTREDAAAERRPMTMRIDAVRDSLLLDDTTEPGVSHLIEVEIVDGPEGWLGERRTLPYDEWMVGAPPPRAGETVITSPARWVRGDGTSRGKPRDGWTRARPGAKK